MLTTASLPLGSENTNGIGGSFSAAAPAAGIAPVLTEGFIPGGVPGARDGELLVFFPRA
jgi:hypothetical protein